MKCDEIKLLLAEYLEGGLSGGDKTRVKEHLRTCADCREELQFLKKYMKKIESFPALSAPDDFIEKIHRRIDTPARGAVINKLFFPLKIKVPLEAAALLALAVTGMLLFKPFKPEVAEYRAEEPATRVAREDERSLTGDRETSRGSALPAVAEKKRKTMPDKKAAAAREESDMVVTDSSVSRQVSREKEKSAGGEQAEITLYLKQNTVAASGPAMDDAIMAESSDRFEENKTVSRKRLGAVKKDKAASESVIQSIPSGENQAAVDGITNLAQSLDGRIIKKVRDGKTSGDQLVIVEIPRKNYTRFMTGLRSTWSVQKQYPAEVSRKASKVQLNINLEK